MKTYVQNTGAYLSDIIYKTFNMYAYEKKDSWLGGWTLLYWGWWISWAPFVGMFIARISRGRTIREFMMGVLFIPTAFTFLWMTVFGNSAINIFSTENGSILAESITQNLPVALFQFFQFFPFPNLLSIIGLILVITFFISSSDSGSLVIDTLTSGGALEPPVWQRVYWTLMEGLVAAILLLYGGLHALQIMTISSAFPMIFLVHIGCLGLIKSLRADTLLYQSVRDSTSTPFNTENLDWQNRLDQLVNISSNENVLKHLENSVKPALNNLYNALLEKKIEAHLNINKKESSCLVIKNNNQEDFIYETRLVTYLPGHSNIEDQNSTYFRTEVFLSQGGQGYAINDLSKKEIIFDVLLQYQKHLNYLHQQNSEIIK
jgi:choline/glycine/proline betaine transport protein